MAAVNKLIAWLRSLTPLQLAVGLLILVATFFRFWNLSGSTQFLGDQGRDALIVADIFREKDFVAIGPTTSVGNIYLGPFYYYFMLPFLFLSYPSPLGPVYAVAILGVATVFLLYYWGRKLVGETAGFFAAFLCTFSYVAIGLSRFSWNPNPTPFVMLGLVYSSYLALTKHPRYWLGVGLAFAVLLQLHYVTLLAGAAAGLLWLWQVFMTVRQKLNWKPVIGYALGAVVIVLLSLTPLVLFDLKHGGLNVSALQKMFTSSGNFAATSDNSRSLSEVLRETHGRSMHILFEFQIGQERIFNTLLVITVAVAGIYFLYKKKQEHKVGFAVLALYLSVGILGFSFYRNSVFDHYIAFLFPVTFLVLGYLLSKLWQWNSLGKIVVTGALLYFLSFNLPRTSFTSENATFETLSTVAISIHQRVEPGQPYGIVLLSVTKDYQAMNYRYFLSLDQEKQPLDVPEQGWAEKLFIIDEEKSTELPETTDIFEITAVSNARVVERYDIPDGPSITVLEKLEAE